ncbi:MAG: hypothetical protein AAF289_11625 [Cyanobacteria bacterium P01_A01_bin.135]
MIKKPGKSFLASCGTSRASSKVLGARRGASVGRSPGGAVAIALAVQLLAASLSVGLWPKTVSKAIALEVNPLQDVALYPLELELLQPGADLTERAVVTRDTVQADQLTLPSLWWAEEQYGGKLLEHWIAYTGEDDALRRVDLVVNRQLWSLYSYLDRYRFIHRFGISALQYGYSSRVFTPRGELLGTYFCPSAAAPPELPALAAALPPCQVNLNAVGLQPERNPFGF